MGNSAVAVLHYDCHDEITKAIPRLGEAMLNMPGSPQPQDFGSGRIISWDHSSGYQVCVIHGNTGWRIDDLECKVPEEVLRVAAEALRRRGYSVHPPKGSSK